MSYSEYPGHDHHYEVSCDRNCGTLLSERATLPEAFEAMIENHDDCRPATVTIVRRGRVPAKKRWRWRVWLHRGSDVETEAAAA